MSLFGHKHTNEEDLGDEYYVTPVDPTIHTDDNPFCDDMSCPCHENQDDVNDLNDAVQDGLASTQDADNIYHGRTIRY